MDKKTVMYMYFRHPGSLEWCQHYYIHVMISFFFQKFRGYCGVRYFEYQDDAYEIPESFAHHGGKRGHHGHRTQQYQRRTGHFEEQVHHI